jgi:hypothetical protein
MWSFSEVSGSDFIPIYRVLLVEMGMWLSAQENFIVQDYLPMKMKALWSFEMSETTDQITQHHIAVDINIYLMIHLNPEFVPSVT